MAKPHSKAWYAKLASQTGTYDYPWRQELNAPSGETLFDALLETLLTPELNVLEAGCGHGRDAQRYAPRVQSYTGYDFTPVYIERAGKDVPQAEFVVWDSSREPLPEHFKKRFDLVISRRGPTSVIPHLSALCASSAQVLCLNMADGEERVKMRLARAGLEPAAEWHVRVTGVLPTLEDLISYRRFHGDERPVEKFCAEWERGKEAGGFPIEEARYLYLLDMP